MAFRHRFHIHNRWMQPPIPPSQLLTNKIIYMNFILSQFGCSWMENVILCTKNLHECFFYRRSENVGTRHDESWRWTKTITCARTATFEQQVGSVIASHWWVIYLILEESLFEIGFRQATQEPSREVCTTWQGQATVLETSTLPVTRDSIRTWVFIDSRIKVSRTWVTSKWNCQKFSKVQKLKWRKNLIWATI